MSLFRVWFYRERRVLRLKYWCFCYFVGQARLCVAYASTAMVKDLRNVNEL